MGDLSGKVVLVTGGSRGIGAAIVRAVSAMEAFVIIHYGTGKDRAEALANEVGADRCHLLGADFTDDGAVRRLWEEAVAWRGRVDVLINNAGVYEPASVDGPFEAWNAAWQRMLRINLVAPAHLCREAILHFRDHHGGIIIINITSRAAHRGDAPDYMQYAASKGGLQTLTRNIARAFAAENVLAYAIAPGFVRTEMAESFIAVHGEAAATHDIPLGELPAPEEVANVAAFLATGKARHTTGATIDINGASYVR